MAIDSNKVKHSESNMTSLPSPINLKCDKTDDGKLKPPHLLHAPRLQVPTISVTDKTPTPTKLLRAADEIGLFQDVDLGREIDPQKGKLSYKLSKKQNFLERDNCI